LGFFTFTGCAVAGWAVDGTAVAGAWANNAATINNMRIPISFYDYRQQTKPRNIKGSIALSTYGQRLRAGPTSARITPRTAFTSRDDQPVFVKIVRSVFLVACVREGGWK
jgi:hypothetical protein